jgi:N-acetylglucosamine kinase-like BadF-type ATPase
VPTRIPAVGVDIGGTWIRLKGLADTGHPAFMIRRPMGHVSRLPVVLKKTFSRLRIHPDSLVIASRGVWTLEEREAFARPLKGLAKLVHVISDVEAAWYGAFGGGRSSILVIAGTGSIALGSNGEGLMARAGGLGPLLGDEGSAHWIARQWIKRQSAQLHSGSQLYRLGSRATSVKRIARLAPEVMQLARQGHRAARQLIQEAQNHLAGFACDVSDALKLPRRVFISWAGSVLLDPYFLDGFKKATKRQFQKRGQGVVWVPPKNDPVTAAARLALYGNF